MMADEIKNIVEEVKPIDTTVKSDSVNEVNEIHEMKEEIKELNNPYKLIAFLWIHKRKEFLGVVCVIESVIILFLLLRYTSLIQTILKLII